MSYDKGRELMKAARNLVLDDDHAELWEWEKPDLVAVIYHLVAQCERSDYYIRYLETY